jgi:hypothetical protein
VQLALQVL